MVMWRLLSEKIHAWRASHFNRKVQRILRLNWPGGARKDGLALHRLQTHLHVEWQARDIHPWDRSFPPEHCADLFVRQALADTGEAISKLFAAIPSVDSIEIRVLDQGSKYIIMSGIVQRHSLSAPRPKSVRIWLGQLGLSFRLAGNRFEPLGRADVAGAA